MSEQSSVSDLHLQVMLPTEVLVDIKVVKVIAEAENGAFCLLTRHVDFTAALVPGVLSFFTSEQEEQFAALDKGILVKCGRNIFVSAFDGVRGTDLGRLQALVESRFLELDEHERRTRTALARLEAGALRGFRELQEQFHG